MTITVAAGFLKKIQAGISIEPDRMWPRVIGPSRIESMRPHPDFFEMERCELRVLLLFMSPSTIELHVIFDVMNS